MSESSLKDRRRAPRVDVHEFDAELRARMRRFYRDAEVYGAQVAAHDQRYFFRYVGTMLRFLPAGLNDVLELGAGSGAALEGYVAERAPARVVGLELSRVNLAFIRARGAPYAAVGGDALQLPFADASFDVVSSFQVIEHLPSVQAALDEALRVLRRPGYLVIGIPNHASLLTPAQDLITGRTRFAFGVDNRTGALRWLAHNAGITLRKRLSVRPQYVYREPRLDAHVRGGDSDAVCYTCPLDLQRDLRARGARLLGTDAMLRWGTAGRFVPAELRGSMVGVWRIA